MKEQNTGEPTNEERGAWARQAVEEFVDAKGEVFDEVELAMEIQDLVTNLLHLAKVNGFRVPSLLKWAVDNYEVEAGQCRTLADAQ